MLYRISGKLADGRPFSSRIDAPDAAQAWTKALAKLTSAKDDKGKDLGIKASDIVEYRVRQMTAVASVSIGKAK
jgi:hypothetical protein